MQIEDFDEFCETLVTMASMYDKELSKGLIKLYFNDLQGLSIDEFRTKAQALRRTCKFMPRVTDFLETGKADAEMLANKAWASVHRALYRIGVYKSVTFRDKVTMMAIDRMGGWQRLGEEDDNHWTTKEFVGNYINAAKQAGVIGIDKCQIPDKFPGREEIENGTADLYLIGEGKDEPKKITVEKQIEGEKAPFGNQSPMRLVERVGK